MSKRTERLLRKAANAVIIGLLFCATFSSCRVCSAEDKNLATLSLSDALKMALGGNASLKQSEENSKASLSKLRIAGFQTTYGIGTSASLDRVAGVGDTSSLLFGNLSYNNLFGTQLSMNLSPHSALATSAAPQHCHMQ